MNFPIDKMWGSRTFMQRWAAKVVAKMLLKENISYQCYGELNWANNPSNTADIQVPAIQMAHWVLRESGYSVCQNDLEKYIVGGPRD